MPEFEVKARFSLLIFLTSLDFWCGLTDSPTWYNINKIGGIYAYDIRRLLKEQITQEEKITREELRTEAGSTKWWHRMQGYSVHIISRFISSTITYLAIVLALLAVSPSGDCSLLSGD
ncbi:hypothetical protein R1flu_003412 [Riccia fluitans]|uniref:Uncharacterized protein n=1 Tax=Riccia fluitans TaxID=41844 RepID=A0ABD1YCE3_9MARC